MKTNQPIPSVESKTRYYSQPCGRCKQPLEMDGHICPKDLTASWEEDFRMAWYAWEGDKPMTANVAIVWIKELIKETEERAREEHNQDCTREEWARASVAREIIDELESNPNEDGSTSPNIQHWIEQKQSQLRKLYQLSPTNKRAIE